MTFATPPKADLFGGAIEARNRFSTHFVIGVILLVGLFYAITLRPGFPWGDDFAMYLLHARNITNRLPYGNTRYIYNPAQPEVGPPSYPPLFPLMLAPVVALADVNSKAIKAEMAVFFLAALWFIYKCLLQRIPAPYAAAVVAALGFNPYLWNLKDNPVSDVPFLLLLFLTFTCILNAERSGWKSPGQSVVLGVLFYLCCACRAAGFVLFPSLFVWEFLRYRRLPRRGVWVSLVVGFSAAALQTVVIRGEVSYADQVNFTGTAMVRHFAEYAWSLRNEFLAIPNLAGSIVLSVLVLLGLVGYVATVRREMTMLEVFAPLYLILVAFWTSDQDLRFLLPVIPLWLLYVGAALVWLGDRYRGRFCRSVPIALALILALGYGNYFARAPYKPGPDGTNNADFRVVCQFLRDKTPQEAVVLFSKPRLLALMTGRESAVYPLGTDDQIIRYARQVGADYVIVGDMFENDRRILDPTVKASPDLFQRVFQSRGFAVYQVQAVR